jgi:hypothetical protein
MNTARSENEILDRSAGRGFFRQAGSVGRTVSWCHSVFLHKSDDRPIRGCTCRIGV